MHRKKLSIWAVLTACSIILFGCAGKSSQSELGSRFPEKMDSSQLQGAIVAVECASYTGNISMDRAQAISLAKLSLAEKIRKKIKALEEYYWNQVAPNASTGSLFDSEQVVKKHIKKARVVKSDTVRMQGNKLICIHSALDSQATKKLFKDLIEQSGAELNSRDKKELYKEFRSKGFPENGN